MTQMSLFFSFIYINVISLLLVNVTIYLSHKENYKRTENQWLYDAMFTVL